MKRISPGARRHRITTVGGFVIHCPGIANADRKTPRRQNELKARGRGGFIARVLLISPAARNRGPRGLGNSPDY